MGQHYIIACWLVVAAVAATGCAAARPVVRPGQAASGELAAFACGFTPEDDDSDAELQARGAMLRLAQPAHSVVLRQVRALEDGEGGPLRYILRTLARVGEECPDAATRSICLDLLSSVELSALTRLGLPSASTPHAYFIVGTGNSFEVRATDHDIRALLGAVDTPAEAWFWLMRSTGVGTFTCDSLDDSAHRDSPSGIELRMRRFVSGCRPLTEALITYRVSTRGDVVELHREIVQHDPEGCVVP